MIVHAKSHQDLHGIKIVVAKMAEHAQQVLPNNSQNISKNSQRNE